MSAEQEAHGGILCVGLLCIDIVNFVERFPAEDTDSRVHEQQWTLGGNGANNMTVLNQFSSHNHFFTTLCNDALYPMVQQLLLKSKINTDLCILRDDCAVPLSTVLVSDDTGSRTILHYRGNLFEPTIDEFSRKIDVQRYSWIHFEGRNFDETRKMMEHVRKHRGSDRLPRISVEIEKVRPAPTLEQLIPGADVVFLSKDFARSRGFFDMESAVNGVFGLFASPETTVVCAWAELGACARLPDGTVVIAPAHSPSKVVDTLAAGDTFVAAMIHYMHGGADAHTALQGACRIAGKKVGQRGLFGLVERDS
uniref:Carbohydrate kinase PfkB domain-containing protein n=1 Tax=Plectus sambesii TaxID=2011161 RepID=A0A914WBH5_9BILA